MALRPPRRRRPPYSVVGRIREFERGLKRLRILVCGIVAIVVLLGVPSAILALARYFP